MLPKFIISLIIVIVGFLLYASTRANFFRVERNIDIKAPPEKIFPFIANLKENEKWSPWEEKDPAMKRTYSGASSGVGVVYEWEGNKQIGKGRMEVLEVVPNERTKVSLEFIAPFKAHNFAEFLLKPNGDGTTNVTWAMYGPQPFIGKVMSIFINCEKMVGPEFEKGLAKLKLIAEQ